MSDKTVIIGLGNILLKDEGFGVHAVRELEKLNLPKNIEVIDGGTSGLDILSFVKNMRKLIIIDAIRLNRRPGSLYCLRPDELKFASGPAVSLHQVGILEVLSVAKKLRCLPEEAIIIGVEPKEIEWGLDLSSEVKGKIPHVVDLVLEEINALEKATHAPTWCYHTGVQSKELT